MTAESNCQGIKVMHLPVLASVEESQDCSFASVEAGYWVRSHIQYTVSAHQRCKCTVYFVADSEDQVMQHLCNR